MAVREEVFPFESLDKSCELRGTKYTPSELADNANIILWIPGHRDARTVFNDIAPATAEHSGNICVTVDLAGHGESEGDLEQRSFNDHVQEVLGGYDHIAALEEAQGRKIAIVGESLGGTIAIEVTGTRQVDGLFLMAPSAYPDDIRYVPYAEYLFDEGQIEKPLRSLINEYKEDFNTNTPNQSLEILRKFIRQAVIIEAEVDKLVPRAVTRTYWQAAPNGILGILPFSDHNRVTRSIARLLRQGITTRWSRREFTVTNNDIVEFGLTLPEDEQLN